MRRNSAVSAILQTERILLREFTLDDVDALSGIQGDPETMRFYPHPFSFEDTEAWIEMVHTRYERDGFALLAVEDRETDDFLGNVGPMVQVLDDVDEIELGWSVTPTRARQGSGPKPRSPAEPGSSTWSVPTTSSP